ncbi:TIR domain-containing protein [Nostoc sp. UHCC 0252]|uniref:TIR domain-containing protein n=1 Tax=Nostoc sp. UHCC 0252 TaxID=3110241 RepID=UPI002B214237|nr:TIR domain-containing protein [Nostoc sp. UHCC 0252]MEA5605376.1 TIR domain-containing protein [Nostoc sp. UHCC 0252]
MNQRKFDVFLAHNSEDKPQVRMIANKLKQLELITWLDEEQIPPGSSFQYEIQEAIPQVKSAIIFIGKKGLGRWQVLELESLVQQCVETKIPIIPVLLPGVSTIPDNLQFLRRYRFLSFPCDVVDDEVLKLLVWGITLKQIHVEQKSKYNIVIAGKSGVGKTSLLNYLFGNKVGKTGTGKPVTSTGFHPTNFMIEDLPVTIFDSWGIEIDKADLWKSVLDEELAKRGVDKSPEQWFHTVFYCVQVGGSRIEDFEINLIKEFLKSKYKVIILLTKADQGGKKDLSDLKAVLNQEIEENIRIISLSSVDDERLDGTKIISFGKQEIFNSIYNDFWQSISIRLPDRCESVVLEYIDKALEVITSNAISERKIGRSTNIIYANIENNYSELIKELSGKNGIVMRMVTNEIKRTLKLYGLFSKAIATEAKEIDIGFDLSIENKIIKFNEYNWFDLVIRVFDWSNIDIGFEYWLSEIKNVFALIRKDDDAWIEEVKSKIQSSRYDFREQIKTIKPNVQKVIEELKNN